MVAPTYQRFVLIDRDGVLNETTPGEYVMHPDELRIVRGAPEGVRLLNDAGYGVLVISNQQCVGKGLMTMQALDELTAALTARIREASGGELIDFFYCPHLASDACSCRKPEPGLITRAQARYGFELAATHFIGDSITDLLAADRAGCPFVFVLTGNDAARHDAGEPFPVKPVHIANDLISAARFVIGRST